MWLKCRTPQNIVIGGAAGALPPVIGWVAATGNVGLEPLILFLTTFLSDATPLLGISSRQLGGETPQQPAPPFPPVEVGKAREAPDFSSIAFLLVPNH